MTPEPDSSSASGPATAPRRPIVVPLVLVLIAAWVLVTVVEVLLAVADVRAGASSLSRARSQANPAGIAHNAPTSPLRAARGRLLSAEHRLDGTLLAPARLLPIVGRQLRSGAALSGAAGHVAGVGIDALAQAKDVLATTPSPGGDRLDRVRRLSELAGHVQSQLAGVRLGPRAALVAPLAHAHNTLAADLLRFNDATARARAALDAVGDMLQGPRRYLVFAANNAEMRAGSGMFLSAGEMSAADGQLRLGDMTTVTTIPLPPPGAVALTGDLADRWAWLTPTQEWRNLMASPRFDAWAPVAADMWAASGHQPVDGVIAVDPVALEAIVRQTGPVTVSGRDFGADDVLRELLHDQYREFTFTQQAERREQLGGIARGAFDALDRGSLSFADLAGALARTARARHVMAWSSHDDEQRAWHAAGVDGSLSGDDLVLSVLNRGGNKLDQFLKVGADVATRRTAKGAAGKGSSQKGSSQKGSSWTVTVHLENTTPDGEPTYIAGPYPGSGLAEGEYEGMLSVALPGAATDGRVDGVNDLGVAGPEGPSRVLGFLFRLPRGEQRTYTIRFELPRGVPGVFVRPSARVPGVAWHSGSARWSDDGTRLLLLD